MHRICVYCGSSFGSRTGYQQAAEELAAELVRRDLELVYGGASVGIMGVLADAVLAAGGQVIGVIPRALVEKEISHPNLSETIIVESMHHRKAKMEMLSDGFIALPGGLGTLEEIFEVLTWGQLGYHQKPCGFLNSEGYYQKLVSFLDNTLAEGFIKPMHREMILMADTPTDLLDLMQNYQAPAVTKWITRETL